MRVSRLNNHCFFKGRLLEDPRVRTTADNGMEVTFILITVEIFELKTGDWEEDIQRHTMVAGGKLAERVFTHLRKGMTILVTARAVHRRCNREEGVNGVTEFIINEFEPLDARWFDVKEGDLPF